MAFRTSGEGVLTDGNRRDRLRIVRCIHVIQAGTVTRLALHVLVPRIVRAVVPRAVGDGVTKLVHAVALLAVALHVAAPGERVPRVCMCSALPARLLPYVTVATDGELRACVVITEKVPGSCRRIIEQHAFDIN